MANACLSNSDFSGAILHNPDMTQVDLRKAVLSLTTFMGTDLSRSVGFEEKERVEECD